MNHPRIVLTPRWLLRAKHSVRGTAQRIGYGILFTACYRRQCACSGAFRARRFL